MTQDSASSRSPETSRRQLAAVLLGLFVAFLWATSWVLIKFGLIEIPPLVFAGVRYFLAFLILLLVFVLNTRRRPAAALARPDWRRLIILGLLLYTVAQGAMFVALNHLPAVTVNLLLSFTSLGVALVSASSLGERQTYLQWAGIGLALLGAVVYFYPASIPPAQSAGFLAAIVCVSANALAVIVGRDVNRSRRYPPLQVTLVSMGAGSIALLTVGLLVEGLPSISLRNWLYILWLALINTAFAFTVWNYTLRTLTATESSIINGTMMIWIPILAVLFLAEHIEPRELLGLAAAGVGSLLVQIRKRTT